MRSIKRARNQTCVSVASRTNDSSSSSPRRWSDSITLCGSGATLKQTGTPNSAATLAPASVPASAMRRCNTSTGPASRSARRMPRSIAGRCSHASLADAAGRASSPKATIPNDKGIRLDDSGPMTASVSVPRPIVSTWSTSSRRAKASPSETSRLATPPVSPRPPRLSCPSSPPVNTSWAIRRPSRPFRSRGDSRRRRVLSARAASVPIVSSKAARRCSAASIAGLLRCPSAPIAAAGRWALPDRRARGGATADPHHRR